MNPDLIVTCLSVVIAAFAAFMSRHSAKNYDAENKRRDAEAQRLEGLRHDEMTGHAAEGGLPAKPSIFERMGTIEAKIDFEFSPNGGRSTYDRLARIEAKVDRLGDK